MTSPLEVDVNGDIEKAFKNLKKKMAFEGIFKELKRRRYYEKPSEEKKRKKEEAERRRLKKIRRMNVSQGRAKKSPSMRGGKDFSHDEGADA
ncbi:MAG TPA: 30S ribosomal protein S21 [Spirochaetota bacterium]|jgi:small subunit ribosomal protein S21|nr:30S ribosomal protein S21 [Spirochaetota bacterium]